MKLLLLTLSAIFIFSISTLNSQAEQQSKDYKEIETEAENLRQKFKASGFAVALIEDGKMVYSKGFGYRDFDNKIPVTEETVFGIGSVTKSFTAALLGILEGEGKLSLQDAPNKHIPELKFNNSAMDNTIRIENLLTHSTGIPNLSSECSAIFFQSEDLNDLVPRLKYLKPSHKVGEQFTYNNYMYAIAGLISQRITGKSWDKNINEMIFSKIEMENSYVGIKNARKNRNLSKSYAVLGDNPGEVKPESVPTRAPAGNIFSNVVDMSKWLNTWVSDGIYKGKQIIPKEYIKEAIRPHMIMSGGPSPDNPDAPFYQNYGYGLFNNMYHGHYKVEHSGGVSGYSANIAFFPNEKIGIVVLTNQDRSGLTFAITNLYVNKMLNIRPQSTDSVIVRNSSVNHFSDPNTKTKINTERNTSHSMETFIGEYSHPGFGTLFIKLKEGVLLAEMPFTTFRLSHKYLNVFDANFTENIPQLIGSPFLDFNFVSGFEGEIDGVEINVGQEPVKFLVAAKESIAVAIKNVLDLQGIEAAENEYRRIKKEQAYSYSFSENHLNILGYEYLDTKMFEKALLIFKLNVEAYPLSFNAYDSLAEAYMKKGENEKAILYYRKSIDLNPENQNGINMLKNLGIEYSGK